MLQVHRAVCKGTLTKYAMQYFRCNPVSKEAQRRYWERAVLRKKLPARFTDYLPAERDLTGTIDTVAYSYSKDPHEMTEQEIREDFYKADVPSILKDIRRGHNGQRVDTRGLFYEWLEGILV